MLVEIGCVYQILNNINGKRYIGSTSRPKDRLYLHMSQLRRGKHHSKHLQRSWDKYGEAAFSFGILEAFLGVPLEHLLSAEQYWMDFYKVVDPAFGYNNVPLAGSNAGCVHSAEDNRRNSERLKGRVLTEEWKNKIRVANKGKKVSDSTKEKLREAALKRPPYKLGPRPPEVKEKLRVAMLGRKPSQETIDKIAKSKRENPYVITDETREKLRQSRLGKVASEETRRRMSLAVSGRKHSPEAREKIRQAGLGRVATSETRAKMSKAKTGIPCSDETKAKISASKKKNRRIGG